MRRLHPAVVGAVFACVVVLDQAVKALVRATLEHGVAVPVIGTFLQLRYVRNTGAAFGMLPGHRLMFMIVAAVVVGTITVYVWRIRPTRPLVVTALGLVSGGAVGNLIDRASTGRVTDFLELPYFPVFNVADSAIVVGTGLLVWWLLFGAGEHPAAEGGVEDETSSAVVSPDGGESVGPVDEPPADGAPVLGEPPVLPEALSGELQAELPADGE